MQHTHLEQVDDPGGFPATSSNRLQDKAAGHHLPSDGVHAGTGQRLLEHGLQGQHAHASLRGTFNVSPKPWKLWLQPPAPAPLDAFTCLDRVLMQQKSLGWLRWQLDGSVRT